MPPKVSVKGRNFGKIQIDNKSVNLLDDFKAPEGTADSALPVLASIPKETVAGIVRKTGDIQLTLKKPQNQQAGGIFLTEIRLAIPKLVAGYEESPDATKEIATMITEKMLGSTAVGADGAAPRAVGVTAAGAANAGGGTSMTDAQVGPLVAEFQDVTITQPNGLFHMAVHKNALRFVDSKKGVANSFTIANTDVLRMCTLPVRDDKTVSYGVLVFKQPLKTIGVQLVRCLCMLIAHEDENTATFSKENPLTLGKDFDSVDKIKKVFGAEKCLIDSAPTMTGTYSDTLFKVLKTVLQVPLVGNNNELNFRSIPTGSKATCCLATTYKSFTGFLYVLKTSLVFVHRNSVFMSFEDIQNVSFDSNGPDTYTLLINATLPGTPKPELLKFVNMQKSDYLNLNTYLKGKNVNVEDLVEEGDAALDDDDDEDEEGPDMEDSLDGSGDDDDDDDDDEDDDEFLSDDDDSDAGKKKKKNKDKKEKKEKKSKKEKKEKKEKKSKKDKKESGKRRDRDD